jgi:hypothetical protein
VANRRTAISIPAAAEHLYRGAAPWHGACPSAVPMPAARVCSRAFLAAIAVVLPTLCHSQQTSSSATPAVKEDKRIFWIIPNYRTSPSLHPYRPLRQEQKFKLATEDAFDRGTAALAVLFAGEAQLTKSNPPFGQGVKGYTRYLGTAYADFVIGDFMTEAAYPALFHQDPRYFRRGTGSAWSRFGYAVGQIFWTHSDSGRTGFNFSELIGNSTAVAISNSYYSDRTVSNAVSKLGVQLGVDMAANVLKEFWPDIDRKLLKRDARVKLGYQDNQY